MNIEEFRYLIKEQFKELSNKEIEEMKKIDKFLPFISDKNIYFKPKINNKIKLHFENEDIRLETFSNGILAFTPKESDKEEYNFIFKELPLNLRIIEK